MGKRTPKREPDQARPKHPDPDAPAPSGISAAAMRGAMQSQRQREGPLRADDRQVQQDDDQEWRRAGGKSPE